MSIIVMTDDDFEKNMQRLADQIHPLLAASFRARDTAQREALAQLQTEMPDLRANMTKALDLLQVLTSTKYTDRAFVEAVDDADEMLAQLRGKVVLKGQAQQQEAQGAAHWDEAVQKDAERCRYGAEHWFLIAMQQIHPTTGPIFWSMGMRDQEWETAGAAIDAAMRAQGDGGTDHA